MLYLFGTEEKETLVSKIDSALMKKVALAGGHHFGGNYKAITAAIIDAAKQ
ncbi:MAG: hypothetical protein JW795_02680 [Chitinivibrionales bacterium]|nr:hypothetical protein [Chitinivibrionales bacterium]